VGELLRIGLLQLAHHADELLPHRLPARRIGLVRPSLQRRVHRVRGARATGENISDFGGNILPDVQV
jgi:hypothetical protein